MTFIIFIFILLAFCLSFLFTPLTIYFAKKFHLVDDPQIRKHPAHTHDGIIPRAGGLPIYIGILMPIVLFLPKTAEILGILVACLLLILVGLWDDKKDRSPYIRLITNFIATLIVVATGVAIPYITSPYGGVIFFGSQTLVLAFTIIWILWTTNIVGWSGGVDGQLPGFVSIAAIIIGLLSFRFAESDPSQIYVTYLSFITAGAFLGFLPWNFYPQKIMPGYGGKTLAGFMLGVLSILGFSKLGTALLVLAVPMTDAVFMLVTRILSGKSPVWATSGHLHHHLLSLGWGKRRIAVFYWMISAFVGVLALFLNSQQKIFTALMAAVVIAGVILWLNFIRKFPKSIEENS